MVLAVRILGLQRRPKPTPGNFPIIIPMRFEDFDIFD